MWPIYQMNGFVTREGNERVKTNAYINVGSIVKDDRPFDADIHIE